MQFEFEDEDMLLCQEAFNGMEAETRLFKTHYELAEESGISSHLWKQFLLDMRVSDWISQELTIIKEAQYRKMIQRAGNSPNSYGAAQMLNALGKTVNEDKDNKEGDIFIYSYVPLNAREQGAPNTAHLKSDIFEKGE